MSYASKLSVFETLKAMNLIKNTFEKTMSTKLNLTRVTAPLVLELRSGNFSDHEAKDRIVRFKSKSGIDLVTVYALAKWKRLSLKKYGFEMYQGMMADAHCVRKDEDLGPFHSYYSDQWSWEKIIKKEDRTMVFLETVVGDIYSSLKETERQLVDVYPNLSRKLPETITLVSSQELEDQYMGLTIKERESKLTEKHGAVFVTQIGKKLKSGTVHGLRIPDSDDWELNGDILLHHQGRALELSSMGIRVTSEVLPKQLAERRGFVVDANGPFHRALAANELPCTVGGGIGKSRMCMFFLEKRHVGECHVSVWDEKTVEECGRNNIKLL